MKLKDQIHRSIDALDNRSLVLIYEHIKLLEKARDHTGRSGASAPSLDEVLELTSGCPGEWSDDIIADREDRL